MRASAIAANNFTSRPEPATKPPVRLDLRTRYRRIPPRATQHLPPTGRLFLWSQREPPNPRLCARSPEPRPVVRSRRNYRIALKAAGLHLRVYLRPTPPAVPSVQNLPEERQDSACTGADIPHPTFVPMPDRKWL